jgi:hypothetical protein
MADWGSYGGERIVSATLTIPMYGIWGGDVQIASDVDVDAQSSIVLGNLTLKAAATRSAPFAGQRKARVRGGYGGWSKLIDKQSYRNDVGVNLSTVLNDAAAAVGEQVALAADSTIGTLYMREAAAASRVLRQLGGPLWYVDPAGVTQVGVARSSALITSDFQVVEYDTALGRATIATDNLADWMPGRTFTAPTITGTKTIASVTHRIQGEGTHRIEVLISDATASATDPLEPTVQDRMLRVLFALVRAQFPRLTYAFPWEYVVQQTDGQTVDATPLDPSIPLPEVVGAPLASSIIGENVTPAIGSICTIIFANGDPTKPRVVGGDYTTIPQSINLAGGGAGAARQDDTVNAGYLVLTTTGTVDSYYPGTTIGAADAAAQAVLISGFVVPMTGGRITSSSSIVKIGG